MKTLSLITETPLLEVEVQIMLGRTLGSSEVERVSKVLGRRLRQKKIVGPLLGKEELPVGMMLPPPPGRDGESSG